MPKSCPFCGDRAGMSVSPGGMVQCNLCGTDMCEESWQERPIEDALAKELEEAVNFLEWAALSLEQAGCDRYKDIDAFIAKHKERKHD